MRQKSTADASESSKVWLGACACAFGQVLLKGWSVPGRAFVKVERILSSLHNLPYMLELVGAQAQ